jgi:phosphopantetheine--protein transferase-like protein
VLDGWPATEVDRGGVVCAVVDDIPADFLEPSGEFWLRALSQLVLSRSERETLRAMTNGARFERRAEWLLGRIAAKDAVRATFFECGGEAVYPADVEIGAVNGERPFVAAADHSEDLSAPHVSIAHKAGRAVAAAAPSNRYAGVGIDIETIEARSESFAEAAFSASERALVATAAASEDQRRLMMTRIWCAKEAVGKALGWGLADILAGLEARSCEEVVQVGVTPSAAHADSPGPFEVATVRDGDFLIALVAIPARK